MASEIDNSKLIFSSFEVQIEIDKRQKVSAMVDPTREQRALLALMTTYLWIFCYG